MINHMSNEKTKITFSAKQLAFCAVSMALAFVLSNIKVFKFPTGGSITLLSMLVACLPGFWFGPIVGIITGVAYASLLILTFFSQHRLLLITFLHLELLDYQDFSKILNMVLLKVILLPYLAATYLR